MFSEISFFVLLLNILTNNAEGLSIISRSEWGAREPTETLKNLEVNPPPYVVIHHSATSGCTTKQACIRLVQAFQNDHIRNRKFVDIGYNFLVGEDGNVYEGRGWGKHGAHAPPLNSKSIGICMIGNFKSERVFRDEVRNIVSTPNTIALNALKELIDYGVANDKINGTYRLVGHRQVKSTTCPGDGLYNLVKTMPHYYSGSLT